MDNLISAQLGSQVRARSGVLRVDAACWEGHGFDDAAVVVTAAVQSGCDPLLRPFLAVTWGRRGFRIGVEVDVGRGVALRVAGSRVGVAVGADAVAVDGKPVVVEGDVAAMLSFADVDVESHVSVAARTRYVDQLASDARITTTIPAFTSTVSPRLVAGSDGRARFFDAAGRGIGRDFELQSDTSSVLIPPDAVSVEVRNNGRRPLDARLVFDIAIGAAQLR